MASPLDLNNVQADILSGLPKKTETSFFFRIDDSRVEEFREQLAELVPMVTTVAQVANDKKKIVQHRRQIAMVKTDTPELLGVSGVNLAFTKKGLEKMGFRDEIGDSVFNAGMLADAENLGDKGTKSSGAFDPEWVPEFKKEIHGVILVTGDNRTTVKERLEEIMDIFSVGEEDATIHKVLSLVGDVRPGALSAHEHFGFRDGISQPKVQGVDTTLNPGQEPMIRQGKILLGREGDTSNIPNVTARPPWALDGSFLVFRYFSQLVPEFDAFLKKNPIPGAPPELGSELLGARLVGRWKSGAPIDLTPLEDDHDLGADPSRNNNFHYDPKSQDRCPFAAHTRKTSPRADISSAASETHRIIRHGIQFGPEVSAEEAATSKTDATKDRGLLFVAYQSNIADGFQFIQQKWANNINAPFCKANVPEPGFDPIIGQTTADLPPRVLSGTDPNNQAPNLTLNERWVLTRGGEYFFSPSIPALKETFALKEAE